MRTLKNLYCYKKRVYLIIDFLVQLQISRYFIMLCYSSNMKTVFELISKHREESGKHGVLRRGMFWTIFQVIGNLVKHVLECLIHLLDGNKN